MSLATQLALVKQYMTRYGMTTYVILGNIGLIFNLAIFSQSTHRRNPCSLYLFSSSICAFLALNISCIPNIYQLDYYSAAMNSHLYCQLQYYFRQGLNLLFRVFFIVACADRYAMLSENARIRSFNQYKVALCIIPCIIVLFLSVSIIPAMGRGIVNGSCNTIPGINLTIYSAYLLIVVGIFPFCSAASFIILINTNLKRLRSRIQPITNQNPFRNQVLRKRDRDMLKMLTIEIISYTMTSLPIVVVYFYNALTQTMAKSSNTQQIEAFVLYITGVFIIYGGCAISFWIYICSSKSFRIEVKHMIIKCYKFLTRKQVILDETN